MLVSVVVLTKPTMADRVEKKQRARRAGLEFPVARIARYLKHGKFAPRVGSDAPVYMTAVLEYMVAEVMELAGKVAMSEVRRGVQ